MTFKKFLPLVVIVCSLPLVAFLCDVGMNPLLFDGSPLTAKFVISATDTSYADSKTIDLSTAISDIKKDIDSVNLINITIRIVNDGSTPAGTKISGVAGFNGTTFLTMTSVAIDSFSTERSIFRLPPGFSLSRPGVRQIVQAVRNVTRGQGPSTATVGVAGTSTHPLGVTVYLSLYTQVFTPPPNK
jgi:hypothetical protein